MLASDVTLKKVAANHIGLPRTRKRTGCLPPITFVECPLLSGVVNEGDPRLAQVIRQGDDGQYLSQHL